jgi:type II secretory pathway pseudopilin PulG
MVAASSNQPRSRQQAFTLIETIIYVGLFGLILSSTIVATYSMIESTQKSQYRSIIHNEAQFMIAKFYQALNGATQVQVSGTQLTATRPGSTSVLSLSGDQLQLDGTTLNSDIAPVSNLSFTPASGSAPVQVKMSFTVNNRYYTESFNATRLLR